MKKINLAEACRDNPTCMDPIAQMIYCRELVERYIHAANETGGLKRQSARIFYNFTGVHLKDFIEAGEYREYNNTMDSHHMVDSNG